MRLLRNGTLGSFSIWHMKRVMKLRRERERDKKGGERQEERHREKERKIERSNERRKKAVEEMERSLL